MEKILFVKMSVILYEHVKKGQKVKQGQEVLEFISVGTIGYLYKFIPHSQRCDSGGCLIRKTSHTFKRGGKKDHHVPEILSLDTNHSLDTLFTTEIPTPF